MFKSGRNILLFIVALLVSRGVIAQQDPHFSQYMFTQLFNNPAYSGIQGVTELSFVYRGQWVGYSPTFDSDGAPTSQLLSFDAPILGFRSGAGLLVVNDHIGVQNNLQILGSYAYHLGVGKGKLSFGLRAGVYSQTIDFDKYRYIDKNDPLLLQGKESQVRPDMSVGVFYKTEKYYGGVALNHIIKTKFDFGIPSDSVRGALKDNMVITGGYLYEVNYEFTLQPSLIVETDFNTYSFDVSLLGIYKERLWFGLSYRLGEAMVGLFGYKFLKDKSLKLGYAMDYVIQAQAAKQKTSQEILLSYTLPAVSGGGKKVIRTPRFRH